MTDNIECFRKIRSVNVSDDTPFPFVFQLIQDSANGLQCSGSSNEQQMRKFNVPNENPNRKYKSRFFGSNILWKIPEHVKQPKRDSDLAFMSVSDSFDNTYINKQLRLDS